MRTMWRALGWTLVVAGLAATAQIGWVAAAPLPGQEELSEQVAFLQSAVDAGGAERMQDLFPEGLFFTHALTGLAAGHDADPEVEAMRDHLAVLDSPASTAVFGDGMRPEHGIFHAGWTLALAVDIDELGRTAADEEEVRRRARPVAETLADSDTGFLASYPGQYWPCDTVVAAAALSRAAVALDEPAWLEVVRDWRARAGRGADPRTGLLPHRVDTSGATLEGPRGSSQALIQTFMPDVDLALDSTVDAQRWQDFTDAFVVHRLGLVGVREYPVGAEGPADVDSGPLLLGVSASASAVTLAAAARVGDTALAASLNRQAELLGAPLRWDGRRHYALGRLPVGDAFLAFARSRPTVPEPVAAGSTPRTRWPLLLLLGLSPALAGTAVLAAERRLTSGRGVAGAGTADR